MIGMVKVKLDSGMQLQIRLTNMDQGQGKESGPDLVSK